MSDKEATIYTHYGTIPVSERRDHKAAQGRVCIFFPPALYHANAGLDPWWL